MVAQEANDTTADRGAPLPRAGLRLLAAWLLAAGLVLAAVLPVIAIVNLDGAIDLSKRARAQIKSAYPDVEASMDGRYVAVVWSRGANRNFTTKDYGYIVLKSARPDPDGWENQVNIFTPTSSIWGVSPRAAFDPVDSGKLYVAWVQCQTTVSTCNKIMATTCTLTDSDRCAPGVAVYTQPVVSGVKLATPDIAADNAGRIHVVWKNETSGSQGIQYARKSGGSWGGLTYVPNGDPSNAFNPALVWGSGGGAHGRLHLVLYQFNDTPTSRLVKYSADNPDSDGWDDSPSATWVAPSGFQFTGGNEGPTVKPSIAASGATVYVAWDAYCTDLSYQNRFHLAYNYSADSGGSWVPGSYYGLGIPAGFSFEDTYLSPLNNIDEEDALRPSIAISGAVPVVAWHYTGTLYAGESGKHVQLIGYREGSGATSWGDPITITTNLNYDGDSRYPYEDSANPDLAIAPGSGVHLVHMGMWGRGGDDPDWDVYYRGNITVDNSSDDAGGAYLPIIIKK